MPLSPAPRAARMPSGRETASRGPCLNAAILIHAQTGGALDPSLGALARAVRNALPRGWAVTCAPPGPGLRGAIAHVVEAGIPRLVVVPLHAHFRAGTTGRALDGLYRGLAELAPDLHVEVRSSWHDDGAYVEALAQNTHRAAAGAGASPGNASLVFLAPGASGEIAAPARRTAELVGRRLGWRPEATGVRFEDGEIRWLGSGGRAREARVVLCPMDVTGDAPPDEGDAVVVPPLLHDAALARVIGLLVRRGRQPARRAEGSPPLFGSGGFRGAIERDLGRLVMVGASVAGALPAPGGEGRAHCTAEEFIALKRPHAEAISLLRRVRSGLGLAEAWLWNTCSRFELYGWFGGAGAERDAAIEEARHAIAGAAGARVMVLEGRAAWRHALRTAAGLNSALIGDAEVVEQMESSVRAAHYAGTAGPSTGALAADLGGAVSRLREGTAWGRFAHRYCETVLGRLLPARPGARCVVVGGSTTSASVVETLTARHGVAPADVTLIYRGQRSGVLARRLSEAVGSGRTLRVESYADGAVLGAAARADLVFLAGDQREPILDGALIASCRDLRERPMTLLDFNTFGSVTGAEGIAGLTLLDAAAMHGEIARFNACTLARPDFGPARDEAERWIERHIEGAHGS